MLTRKRQALKSSSGFSLLEVMMAIMLLGLVFYVAFSIYSFGVSSFQRGSERMSSQQEARVVSNLITGKVRYAREIRVLQAVDSPLSPGYIYIFSQDGNVVLQTSESLFHLGDNMDSFDHTVSFASESPAVIRFKVGVLFNSSSYGLETSVVGLNLGATLPAESGPVLRYKP